MADRAAGTRSDRSLRNLRAVVHENPYALVGLPRHIFCGPHDERYGQCDGCINRIFVGEEIEKLEAEENEDKQG